MSSTNGINNQNGNGRTRSQEIMHLIETRNWEALDRLVGMSPEEAERILREEPMIDAADFNRLIVWLVAVHPLAIHFSVYRAVATPTAEATLVVTILRAIPMFD